MCVRSIVFFRYMPNHSSIVLIVSHLPARSSFHSVTLLSAWLTASTLPLKLHEHLHTTASNSSVVLFHSFVFGSEVHMRTLLSCDADAIYDLRSTEGDQATSRTQSVWPSSVWLLIYVFCSGLSIVRRASANMSVLLVHTSSPRSSPGCRYLHSRNVLRHPYLRCRLRLLESPAYSTAPN
jgi:hypothetical protein